MMKINHRAVGADQAEDKQLVAKVIGWTLDEHCQFGMAGSTVSTFLIWFVKISGNWEEAPQFPPNKSTFVNLYLLLLFPEKQLWGGCYRVNEYNPRAHSG